MRIVARDKLQKRSCVTEESGFQPTDLESDRNKVSLRSINNPSDYVIFQVTPELTESRSVQYKTLDMMHSPGSIFAYNNSGSRTFSMSVKLISRTTDEATANSFNLQILRSWTLPYFGVDSLKDADKAVNRDVRDARKKRDAILEGHLGYGTHTNIVGQPPDVLYLNAYSDPNKDVTSRNINNVPVVLSQINLNYPADVAYFPTQEGEPFPTIMNIDLVLNETHSPQEYKKFSLGDFRNGALDHF